jgi:hypothetical protein
MTAAALSPAPRASAAAHHGAQRGVAEPARWPADELIRVQAMAARAACQRITAPTLKLLLDSVDRACCLPARPGWEVKAAAHAEIFHLLADVAGGPAAAGRPGGHGAYGAQEVQGAHGAQVRLIGDLMLTVGPAANGMITSSRRRLLARLRAGDAEGAALEMEDHLRALHYMWRLAHRPAQP